MMLAVDITQDEGRARGTTSAILMMESGNGLLCRHIDGDWHAVVIVVDNSLKPVPPCFEFNDEALEALNELL